MMMRTFKTERIRVVSNDQLVLARLKWMAAFQMSADVLGDRRWSGRRLPELPVW